VNPQAAYRRTHSTQTCLINTLDEDCGLAEGHCDLFDFSKESQKGLDRMHEILIKKFRSMYLSHSMLTWVAPYFTNRTQVVRDRGSNSRGSKSVPANVMVGVPQDSVFGPVLFSLYLSDFRSTLRNCR